MKNNLYILLFISIVLVAALVRLTGLDKSPPSLGFDEAALGYNAYSIMKTGRDEYGNLLPISLRSFNDYKPAMYAYLTIPFIKFFGVNDASVRMVSAMAGIISVIFLGLLLKEYFSNKYFALMAMAILSFEPWRLHFSRNAFETNLSAMFFLVGSYLLLKLKKNKWWSLLFFGMSAYSYHSARLSVPMLLLFWAMDPILIFVNKNIFIKENVKKLWMLLVFVIIALPIFAANNSSLVLTRFRQENVFNKFYPYAPKELVNPISSLYYFGGIIAGHIFSHVSPINLNFRIYDWVKMSPQFIPQMGMLGWIEGVVFCWGLVVVIGNIFKNAKYRFLIYWMVAGIAPAAATWTWFHPLRSLNIYPAVEVIVVIGAWEILRFTNVNIRSKITKMLVGGAVSLLIGLTIVFTINNELLYSAFENHGEYQPGGYKEGMTYLKSIQDNYDKIVIDTPHAQSFIFLFYYQQMDPSYIQQFADLRPKPGTEGNLIFNFGKFEFRKVDWPKDRYLKKTVFWAPNTISKSEVEAVPGAKLRKIVTNALYDTADIITIE